MSFEQVSGELVVESVVTVDEYTPASVAVAAHQGAVHLAWTGRDHHINILSAPDAYHFAGKQTLPYKSIASGPGPGASPGFSAPPSLASGRAGLLIGWPYRLATPKGHMTVPCVMWSPTATRDGGWSVVGQDRIHQTSTAIQVVAAGDEAVVVWAGRDNRARMARSQGKVFGQPLELGKFQLLPSLYGIGRELALVWVDYKWLAFKPNLKIMWSRGGTFGEPTSYPGLTAATLGTFDDEVAMCWQQDDKNLVGFLRHGTPTPALGIQKRALGSSLPKLCQYGDSLILAWADNDKRIVVARLRRA